MLPINQKKQLSHTLLGFKLQRFGSTVRVGLEAKERIEANHRAFEESAANENRLAKQREEAKRVATENLKRRRLRQDLLLENSDEAFNEARGRWQDKQEAAKEQTEEEQKTKIWTTPGLRPLVEPPIVDWEQFVRWYMPSELRFHTLFPTDSGKRATMKDLVGERNMLSEYADHALLTGEDSSTDDARRAFYQTLRQDLLEDYDSVHKESIDLWYAAAELGRYEHANLDNDSKTTKLSAALAKGANIFHTFGDSVRQKYGHLVPDDFVEHHWQRLSGGGWIYMVQYGIL